MRQVVESGGDTTSPSLPGLRFAGDHSWREHAACAKMPKELFFCETRGKKGDVILEESVAVCRRCPVKEQCLEFAVKNNEPYGQWAGTFPKERAEMYKEYLLTGIVRRPTAF